MCFAQPLLIICIDDMLQYNNIIEPPPPKKKLNKYIEVGAIHICLQYFPRYYISITAKEMSGRFQESARQS